MVFYSKIKYNNLQSTGCPRNFFFYIESINLSNSNMGVPTGKYLFFGDHEWTLKNVNRKYVVKALQIIDKIFFLSAI